MSRFHAAALATVLLLPAALNAQPQDCGSIIARDPQLARATEALQHTVQPDIDRANGVVHKIDHVLVR